MPTPQPDIRTTTDVTPRRTALTDRTATRGTGNTDTTSEPARPLGVFTVEGCPAVITTTGRGEARVDLLGSRGVVTGPLGAVTGLDTAVPLLFLDTRERAWASEPAIAWHITRTTVDRYRSTPVTAIENPSLPDEPHLRDTREAENRCGSWKPVVPSDVRSLGTMVVEGRIVVVTMERPGRARVDLLVGSGAVAAPLGVVTALGTAIPLLYLDTGQLDWAGEPAIAWHITRTVIDRYRSDDPNDATTDGPVPVQHTIGTEASASRLDSPTVNLASALADPEPIDDQYRHWFGDAQQRRSHAHSGNFYEKATMDDVHPVAVNGADMTNLDGTDAAVGRGAGGQ
ncbi:hypothetical protein [Stackebrandtia soli]|uniref:hypothetical protein n=1 Tax=Stackebrandtia soli TaxID=1892856 RepID=UPI0039EABB3F